MREREEGPKRYLLSLRWGGEMLMRMVMGLWGTEVLAWHTSAFCSHSWVTDLGCGLTEIPPPPFFKYLCHFIWLFFSSEIPL